MPSWFELRPDPEDDTVVGGLGEAGRVVGTDGAAAVVGMAVVVSVSVVPSVTRTVIVVCGRVMVCVMMCSCRTFTFTQSADRTTGR